MPSINPPQTVLIVGGGEFGSTTALELARTSYKGHADLITVLDRSATPPATDAASYDFNKIVRQEYSDPLYAKLAHGAMDLWRSDWAEFYHECGVVVSVSSDTPQAKSGYIQRALAANAGPGMQTPGLSARVLKGREEVAQVYPDIELGDFAAQDVYINYAGGWANARGATEAAVSRARALGVRFVGGTATALLTSGSRVTGVETDRGPLCADVVVLALGSWTPTLLPELGTACLPTGQVVGVLALSAAEAARYAAAPVTRLIDNGFYVFPPARTDAGWVLKFAIHQKGFLNPQPHCASLPRTQLSRGYELQQIPDSAREQLRTGLARVYPALAAREWKATRLCWYSDRPTGDFLLDWHPTLGGLFVAAGCCGHAFKFLPIMGGLITRAMEGTLEPELREIWSWDGKQGRRDESRDFSAYQRLDQESRL